MRFPIRIEKKWTTTWFGAAAMLATLIAALWLAVYFLNELKWILKGDEAAATQQQYERGWLRATSGEIHSDSTPGKTLQGFVDALRAEDIDAALAFVAGRFREEARAWFAQFEAEGGDFTFLSDYIVGMQRREGLLGGVEYYRPSTIDERVESILYLDQDSDGEWRLTFSLY